MGFEEREKMEICVSPNIARIACRQKMLIPFVVWSALRAWIIANNYDGSFLKSQAKNHLRSLGLNYTDRHFNRILDSGMGLFWQSNSTRFWMRGFWYVHQELGKYAKPCDVSPEAENLSIKIQLSKSLQALEAEIYWAWFLAVGERIVSRDTLQDLFGFSHDTQRALESLLAGRLKVSHNYAHIAAENYAENPKYLPEHNFSIKFEREIRFDEDIETVTYIQFQLPNSYLARPNQHSDSDAALASNAVRWVTGKALRRELAAIPTRRKFFLKWRDFERFGSMDSFIRCFRQGKKCLFLLGHYL